jgi:hypothetical protein
VTKKCPCSPEWHRELVARLARVHLTEPERKEIERRAAVRAGFTVTLAALLEGER